MPGHISFHDYSINNIHLGGIAHLEYFRLAELCVIVEIELCIHAHYVAAVSEGQRIDFHQSGIVLCMV